jgi:hypothetical protein
LGLRIGDFGLRIERAAAPGLSAFQSAIRIRQSAIPWVLEQLSSRRTFSQTPGRRIIVLPETGELNSSRSVGKSLSGKGRIRKRICRPERSSPFSRFFRAQKAGSYNPQ